MNDQDQPKEEIIENPVLDLNQDKLLTEEDMHLLEKKIEQQVRIKQMVLRTTKAHHWTIHGDKAYLERDGVNAVCSFLGVGLKPLEPIMSWEEDEEGRYYVFTTPCTATFRGVDFTDYGTASSRDPFFTKGGKLPQSEVPMGNIKKKSITNAMHRAVIGRLGLDFMVNEVEAALGCKLDGSRSVNYKSGNKPPEELTKADTDLKKLMKKKIWAMCDEDPERCKKYVRELTAFNDFKGHEQFDRITMKQLNFKKKKIEEDYQKWEQKQTGGMQPPKYEG